MPPEIGRGMEAGITAKPELLGRVAAFAARVALAPTGL